VGAAHTQACVYVPTSRQSLALRTTLNQSLLWSSAGGVSVIPGVCARVRVCLQVCVQARACGLRTPGAARSQPDPSRHGPMPYGPTALRPYALRPYALRPYSPRPYALRPYAHGPMHTALRPYGPMPTALCPRPTALCSCSTKPRFAWRCRRGRLGRDEAERGLHPSPQLTRTIVRYTPPQPYSPLHTRWCGWPRSGCLGRYRC
jgi:hypothetical protein